MNKATEAPIYLVTGLSGAGKSTCLHVLEDLGYEAVDNLPLSLLPALIEEAINPDSGFGPLAVGIDIRSRNFDVSEFIDVAKKLQADAGRPIRLLYVECDDESLISRYNQTRRPHPLAQDSLEKSVALERELLNPLKERADLVIDSTGQTIWQFRSRLKQVLGDGVADKMVVTLMSFSFAKAIPRDADLVFDVRFLQNPHYIEELRPLTGQDHFVQEYVRKDPDFASFMEKLTALLDVTMPRYQEEGKSHLTIAIGCTGGRHRSVFVAEELGNYLQGQWSYHVTHTIIGNV
ncbi:RNase adapter RapZ [Curvivirga aplysinae]|uniref:RNase adapter RapZ n=1 Tax=Curvivirga aplysinae TaxID=2529852 RepID=UPI001C3F533C|nr:RNase adapter RapZ [Curvivirga aplysinae]